MKRDTWYEGEKPHVIWSPHFQCYICAGQYRDGSGDTPKAAYEAWEKSR